MKQRPVIAVSMNYMQLGTYLQDHIRDTYVQAIYDYGALPLLIPCSEDKDLLRQYLALAGALIIIGGMDYPPALYGEAPAPESDPMEARRAASDFLLMDLVMEMDIPLLGICAGMQLINIYFGGKLIQHIAQLETHFGEKYHPIRLEGSSHLTGIFPATDLIVNSNHHQAVDPRFIGRDLRPIAFAEDGGIEALEHSRKTMLLGIQWHPERITDLGHRKLIFEHLTKLASRV